MSLTLPPPGIEVVLLALVLGAALYDIRYRRIPNWLTLPGVLVGLGLNTFLYQGWPGLRVSLLGLVVGFGIYFVLYALRAMGAGDVKLMAAIGSLVGWADWFGIFVITAVIGGVAALVLAVLHGRLKKTLFNVGFILSEMKSGRPAFVGKEELDVRNPKALGLPHGAVIAVGSIAFLIVSAYYTK
jgi:prepilin peptidase CpaA